MRKLRQREGSAQCHLPSVTQSRAELRCKPRRSGCGVMVLPVLPSGFQGEGCEVCPMQGWRATRQRHLVCNGRGGEWPVGDLGCSGEGTRRSHAGEGSAFWAVGVRDSIRSPYLPIWLLSPFFLLCVSLLLFL